MKRFIWLKEIYLTMAYELIIGATIDIAKLFASIKVSLSFFWIFNVLDFLIMITWKLVETNSIILGIWTLLSYFGFSFLSSFFPVFCFFSTVQRSRLQCKSKFIFPYVLCFYKSRHHINVVLHTHPKFFIKFFPHCVKEKSSTWKFRFNDIYTQSKQ